MDKNLSVLTQFIKATIYAEKLMTAMVFKKNANFFRRKLVKICTYVVITQVMDTYCWIHSTFSVPSRVKAKKGMDYTHPGLNPYSDLAEGKKVSGRVTR
jgi:hypothetical protein